MSQIFTQQIFCEPVCSWWTLCLSLLPQSQRPLCPSQSAQFPSKSTGYILDVHLFHSTSSFELPVESLDFPSQLQDLCLSPWCIFSPFMFLQTFLCWHLTSNAPPVSVEKFLQCPQTWPRVHTEVSTALLGPQTPRVPGCFTLLCPFKDINVATWLPFMTFQTELIMFVTHVWICGIMLIYVLDILHSFYEI